MQLLNLRRNIKFLREERRMTQGELGERLGKTYSTVARWEAGTSSPQVNTVLKMAELFDVDIEDLLNYDLSDPESNRGLTDEEVKFIDLFRELSEEGKEKAWEQLEFFASKYSKKSHTDEMVG